MSMLYRTQLLLEPEQHEALAQIAQQEGRSLSDLMREIVRKHLAEKDECARQEAALRAIEELTSIRNGIREEHGVYQGDLVAEVRAEREAELADAWRGEP